MFINLKSVGQTINVDSLERNLLIELRNVLEHKNFDELLSFKKSKFSTNSQFPFNRRIKLIDSFYFESISINIEYNINSSTTSYYGFDLITIHEGNNLIYYKIYEPKSNQKTEFQNSLKLKILKTNYAKFYFKKLNIGDLEKFRSYTYGRSCGLEGGILKERAKMEKYLAKRNISLFNNWISSPSAELKAYAYEAFKRLENQGVKLSEKHRRILKYLESDDTYLMICNGCVGSRITLSEMTQGILDE